MKLSPSLFEIGLYFATLSLMAIGGANAVIPDMHRHLVDVSHWMTSAEFVSLVALDWPDTTDLFESSRRY